MEELTPLQRRVLTYCISLVGWLIRGSGANYATFRLGPGGVPKGKLHWGRSQEGTNSITSLGSHVRPPQAPNWGHR